MQSRSVKLFKHLKMLTDTYCDLQMLIPTYMNFHLKTLKYVHFLYDFYTATVPEITLNYTRRFRSCIKSMVP